MEEFVGQQGDALLRLATVLTSDPDRAEDAYQETLHRLAARWSRVDNPLAYSRRVLHTVVIDQARLRQSRPPETQLLDGHDGGDPRAADSASAVEVRPVLLAALRALTWQQRVIMVLRYFDDRSEIEVAELLGISRGTVKSTASRAMARLRQQPGIIDLLVPANTGT